MKIDEKLCVGCGKVFTPTGRNQSYCEPRCRREHQQHLGISSGTLGAIGELQVATDLLSKGYEVFRAVSPNCSADMVIRRDGRLFVVEVKTGRRGTSGRPVYPAPKYNVDIVAVVLPDEIIYVPDMLPPPQVPVPPVRTIEEVAKAMNIENASEETKKAAFELDRVGFFDKPTNLDEQK